MYKMLILDTMPKKDSPYEGQVLRMFLSNMGWHDVTVSRKIYRKDVFLNKLFRGWKHEIIHFASHGKDVCGGSLTTATGWFIEPHEIISRFGKGYYLDKTSLVVSTGCDTGTRHNWAVFKELGAKAFIGLEGSIDIDEGIIFSFYFYKKLASMNRPKNLGAEHFRRAFNYAKRGVKFGEKFVFYPEQE